MKNEPIPTKFSFQGTSSNRKRRGRFRRRTEQPRQGAVVVERRPQVAGDDLCVGQLQDGAVQKAAKALQTGLRLPTVSQQQRQAKKSQEIQISVRIN